jgi:hypothetical protein
VECESTAITHPLPTPKHQTMRIDHVVLSKVLILVRPGLRPIVFATLLTLLHSAVAHGEPLFDESKRVVLPSEAATSILKRHSANGDWRTDEWTISSENLDRLEVALASALAKSDFGLSSFKTRDFYRQYMPARWKDLHVIIVNGFYASQSDLFPNRGIAPDRWKHELVTVFGGGCGFWYTVYVVERNRLMVFQGDGSRRHATVVCNAPK